MKAKQILLIIILCLVCLCLGFAGAKIYKEKKSEMKIVSTTNDSIQKKNIDSSTNQKQMSSSTQTEQNFSKTLKGKYILAGADYAGFEFIDSNTITWTNEMFPMDPHSMRLKWIDGNTFVTIFNQSEDDDCAPPVWIRKVEFYDGNKLVIRNFWTGRKDLKDSSETFYKK
ncbi:hypothetical protein [Epilithonimonas xixisoli]|uniref:Uncharacterized protein FAM165 n=1 Tax=Epilithonimonas xixisoli TaxID=1476462 RepID=A0A4R8I489_9FLAO|nr:hypothetical protein [Epilithonimonas xixisoli]TDX83083.1 uncharacterized protein FAM165 [Epilithonimonas xixisoli]